MRRDRGMNWVEELLGPLKKSAHEWQFPEEATDELICRAEAKLGFVIGDDYKDLLRFSSGPCIGRDGFAEFTSVLEHGPRSYTNVMGEPAVTRGWLPVTTDGCGNYFVIMRYPNAKGRPVAFFESSHSSDIPRYFVASSFRKFLLFWVADHGRAMSGWPFEIEKFRLHDPIFLSEVEPAAHPWNN